MKKTEETSRVKAVAEELWEAQQKVYKAYRTPKVKSIVDEPEKKTYVKVDK